MNFKCTLVKKLTILITICIVVSVLLLGFVFISFDKNKYLENYTKSIDILTKQITNNFDNLQIEISNFINTVDNSKVFESFINDQDDENKIFQMQKELRKLNINNKSMINNFILLGKDEVYINNRGNRKMSISQMNNTEIVKKSYENPNKINYFLNNNEFSSIGNYKKSIAVSKVLVNKKTNKKYGIAIIFLSSDDFKSLYTNYFDNNINTVYVINKNGLILSSNKYSEIGKKNQKLLSLANNNKEYKKNGKTIITKNLYYQDSKFVSIINNDKFYYNSFNIFEILISVISVIIFTIIVVYIFIKKLINPIEELTENIKKVRKENLKNYIDIQCDGEIKELMDAYNKMLLELDKHLNEIIELNDEKNKKQLELLQLQINPHFIYNTLSSIKFLILANEKEKAIVVMDSFINLLKNILYMNENEISVEEELKNVKNYINIQNARYGEKVNVNFYINENCKKKRILKMVIQPFLENCYFHAFSNLEKGIINIFISCISNRMIIEIMDNGNGDFSNKKSPLEKMSGIGVENVKERIYLFYGDKYGVTIKSKTNEGTLVRIELPIIE